ncbi:MAG: C10 family peptidase [Prevotella sp.]|nr:C10 family peptidase [Prevotella sp.]
MRKAFLTLLLVAVVLMPSSGAPVTPAQALQKAAIFLSARGSKPNLSLVRQERQGAPSNQATKEACYYVFNQGDGQGFVIVSGDDAAYDILGYSDEGRFDQTDVPKNLQALLDDYANDIAWARANVASTDYAPANAPSDTNDALKVVAPLLTCHWAQKSPYNHQCFTTSGAQSVTGCVATALAQVMYYYKWPRTSTTEIPAYSTYSALPSVTFDWASMLDSYNESSSTSNPSNKAVSTLMVYCGHAVQMKYYSGVATAATASIPNALCNYFGYDNLATMVKRDKYDINGWFALVYEELAAGRPVIYSASSSNMSHAFVCDGFDGQGLFHINWGWGGLSDGYFRLEALNPLSQGTGGSSTSGGYSNGQYAIIGISPQPLEPFCGDSIFGIINTGFTLIDESKTEIDVATDTCDATNGLSPFRVKYLYSRIGVEPSYDVGIGLFDKDGQMIDTRLVRSNYQSGPNTNASNTFYLTSFGRNLDDGTYEIKGIDRINGTEEWRLSKNASRYYLQVEKSGDQATLHTKEAADITVNQVMQNHNTGTSPKCIRVFVKNNGDNDFNSPIYFYMNNKSGKDSLVTYETPYLPPGAEDYIDFYLKKNAGTYKVTFSLGSGPSNIIYSNDAFVLTDESTIPVLDFVSAEVKNIEDNYMYGSLIDGSITLTNNTSVDYDSPLSLKLMKPKSSNVWWVFTETLPVYIPAGQTVTTAFQIPISVGEKFRLSIYDSNQTYANIPAKTVKAAFVTWKADGERTATAPTDTLAVPDDAAAVSFEELGALSSYTITANDNPNTLYYLHKKASVPDILQGRNVVKDTKAESITLTDGHDYHVPKTFHTSHIAYTRRPTLACDGQTGWQTIHLPFPVQEVTSNGSTLSQLHDASSEEGYWLKMFDSDDGVNVNFSDVDEWTPNTPFLFGTSASCKDHDLVLGADDAWVLKTPACIMKSKNYQFIGTTCDKSVSDAYVLNDEGTAFMLTNIGDVDAFQAYFITSLNLADAPMLLPLASLIGDINGDATINISDITTLVDYILERPCTNINISNADVNGDGEINVIDMTCLVNIVLNR